MNSTRQPLQRGARWFLLLLLLLAVATAWLYPELRGGVAMLWLGFLVVLKSPVLRNPPSILWLVTGALALRYAVAAANTWFGPLPGAETDAVTFHSDALGFSLAGEQRFVMDHLLFSRLLGLLYLAGGSSVFTASSASVFMFALSCLVLSRLLDLLQVTQGRLAIFALFALWPSQVLLLSVPLRESWLVLLLLLACYNGLKFSDSGRTPQLLYMVTSLLAAALIHRIFVYLGIGLTVMFLAASMLRAAGGRSVLRTSLWQGLAVTAVIGLLLAALYQTAIGQRLVFTYLYQELPMTMEVYRANLLADLPRSDFGVYFDSSSLWAMITSFGQIYFYYLFSPFPHMVTTVADAVAAAEGLLRMLLMVMALVALVTLQGVRRRHGMLLFTAFMLMTLVWAAGTVCYGQAIRHHVLTNWIVTVLGVMGLWGLWQRRRNSR